MESMLNKRLSTDSRASIVTDPEEEGIWAKERIIHHDDEYVLRAYYPIPQVTFVLD